MAGETRKFDHDSNPELTADPAIKPIDLGMPRPWRIALRLMDFQMQMIFDLGDIIGAAFRGHKKTSVVRSWLRDHEIRLVRDSSIEPREHARGGVERSARIRNLHVVACTPEHLLQNQRIGLFRIDGPTRRIAGAYGYNSQ